ncbi:MAG: glutaredoxin 3 [Bdellovibrionota bacterium]
MNTSLPVHPKQASVIVYSKDYCPYCTAAKNLLTQKGVGYTEIDLSKNPELRDDMIQKAGGRTTVPQIFIADQHVGGFDDMKALDEKESLDAILFPNGK